MNYDLLISAEQLLALGASQAPLMIFDCTFELTDPAAGHNKYLESHIPGSGYADLDKALSDKTGAGVSGGRHPLPSRETFAAWLSSVGLQHDMQAVVYDRNGANYCGRLWWMLKWAGHKNVAVLNGGLQAWQAAGGAVSSGAEPTNTPSNYVLGEPLTALVATQTVADNLGRPIQTLIDARGAPRFRGEVEPLDPVAGHIPGALNRPFNQNMTAEGKFKPAAELKAEFEALLAGRDPATVVHHCGSGVSAVPNIIAMQIAGLADASQVGLYAGSWSDWCSDASRPMAQG